MVTHTTIQKYKQNYFALCITGLFGCKWHRYKQSMSRSKKVSKNIVCLFILGKKDTDISISIYTIFVVINIENTE